MRLGTSAPLEHSNPKDWAKKQKNLGLSTINFHLTCESNSDLIDAYINEAKKEDFTIAEVGVWRNVLNPNEEDRQAAIRYAIGQLELADSIGARCCVNIMGARGPRWDGPYKENFTRETWNLGVRTIQEIIDAVNPKHTYFTIESMPWMYPTGPDEYLELLEAVDRESFAVHMDFFNWITTPKRYFFNEEFADECFEKLGRYIKSCHLKDVKMTDEYMAVFKETTTGNGGINIKYLIQKAMSYDREMSFIIEHLNTDEEYIQSVRYIQNLMNLS